MADEKLTLTTVLIDEASTPLQKLKRVANESLDSIAASTVATVGAVVKGAGGIAGAMATAATGVWGAAKKIGGGIASIGRGIADVASGALKTAGVAAAALAGIGIAKATEIIAKGFQRVITLQDATAQSAVLMGGDVGKATDFIEKIRDVVTGTPFALPDFAKAGQQLLMYGISAEKIPGILTAVGEATAGSGANAVETAQQMTSVMSKMAATGKVQLDDMWSMSDAGIPALKILANGFGLTTDQMQKMISKGAVPATEAIDILTKGIMEGSDGVAGSTMSYKGSMKALGDTWSGALQIFDAAKGRLGEAFIKPMQDAMPGIIMSMKGILDALQGFAPMWKKWLDESGVLGWVKEKLDGVAAKIKELASGGLVTLLDKMSTFAPALGAAAGGLLAMSSVLLGQIPIIGQFLPAINPILGVVLGLIAASPELRAVFVGAFKTLLELLQPLKPVFEGLALIVGQVLTQVMGALVGVVKDLLTAVLPIIPMFATFAAMLITSLAPILPPIIQFLGAVAGILVGALMVALTTLLPPLISFITRLIDMLAPILPVIFGGLVQLLGIFTPLIPIVVEIAGVFLDLAMKFIEALLPPLMELIPMFLELARTIGGAVMTVLLAIAPVLLDLLEALLPLIPPIMDLIALFLKFAIEILTPLMPVITEVGRLVADILTLALKDALPFIKDLIKFVTDLATALKETLQPILSTIGGMFKGIGGFIGDVVRGIGDFIKAGWEKITGFINFITGRGSGGGLAGAMGGAVIGVRHFADGGVIGGYAPGKDVVPAMLSPGEAVLVPELVRALGARNIMAANFAYSGGRPAMAGSGDRTGGNPVLGGGGTQVTVIVAEGAVQISGSGPVDSEEIRKGLAAALEDAARRAY